MSRVPVAFGLLILTQAAHSVEEYLGRLWESFPPARLVSSVISNDLETGFLIANVLLLGFGVWCWPGPIRRGWSSARPLVWTWIAVEVVNGIGHPALALRQGRYTPGLATAPALRWSRSTWRFSSAGTQRCDRGRAPSLSSIHRGRE